MMQKKYLLVYLVTAALLTGCSSNGAPQPAPEQSSGPAVSTADPEGNATSEGKAGENGNGTVNSSIKDEDIEVIPAKTFEDGKMEVVELPKSVTERKDVAAVPLGKVSGSVVDTETEVIAVYNTFKLAEMREWVKNLKEAGWEESKMDTLDNETTYNVLLSKDDKMISLYSNNTPKIKNTVIAFSK